MRTGNETACEIELRNEDWERRLGIGLHAKMPLGSKLGLGLGSTAWVPVKSGINFPGVWGKGNKMA